MPCAGQLALPRAHQTPEVACRRAFSEANRGFGCAIGCRGRLRINTTKKTSPRRATSTNEVQRPAPRVGIELASLQLISQGILNPWVRSTPHPYPAEAGLRRDVLRRPSQRRWVRAVHDWTLGEGVGSSARMSWRRSSSDRTPRLLIRCAPKPRCATEPLVGWTQLSKSDVAFLQQSIRYKLVR
jgi:hypothetical protein